LAEFEFVGHSPLVRTPKNVALGYDVGGKSAQAVFAIAVKLLHS